MITIEVKNDIIVASAFGEFTLADYREFENAVTARLAEGHKVNVLFDTSDMVSFTLDVAWEDMKFAREHPTDFGRVAVVSDRKWVGWITWVYRVFVEAELETFDNYKLAADWIGIHPA